MKGGDESAKTMVTAGCVAPMNGPLLAEGGVVMERGRILAVGRTVDLRIQHPDAIHVECGNATLFPGLVNAHAHLDLTGIMRPVGPISFCDWATHLMAKAVPHRQPEHWLAQVAEGCRESLRFGVTAVGDICGRFVSEIRASLTGKPIHATSYGEVMGMGERRGLVIPRLAVATNASTSGEDVQIGITPHAPYSIEPEGYRQCLAAAKEANLPLATHLAELPYEAEFLADHSGPLRDLWNKLGGWDDRVPRFEGGPIRYAKMLGLLDYPTLLAHVNYCDDDELGILSHGVASVVYCPRTHAYFGHPPHRWREMLAAGLNVALGTDSAASSPDLNLVEEMRAVHLLAPEVPVEVLWQMVTTRAAKAIGDDRGGSLAPGKRSDLVAFKGADRDVLRVILEGRVGVWRVWTGGVERVAS